MRAFVHIALSIAYLLSMVVYEAEERVDESLGLLGRIVKSGDTVFFNERSFSVLLLHRELTEDFLGLVEVRTSSEFLEEEVVGVNKECDLCVVQRQSGEYVRRVSKTNLLFLDPSDLAILHEDLLAQVFQYAHLLFFEVHAQLAPSLIRNLFVSCSDARLNEQAASKHFIYISRREAAESKQIMGHRSTRPRK